MFALAVELIVWHIVDLPTELHCCKLFLNDCKDIMSVQLVSLLHPTQGCWGLWAHVHKLDCLERKQPSLNSVNSCIHFVGIFPWGTSRVTMFDCRG
jgi:hypothetical protein